MSKYENNALIESRHSYPDNKQFIRTLYFYSPSGLLDYYKSCHGMGITSLSLCGAPVKYKYEYYE